MRKPFVRAGYGIYYNPNQMNSFTFLTTTRQSPPCRVQLGSREPDVVVPEPLRRRRTGRPAGHDLAHAGSSECAQEPVERRHPARALAGDCARLQYVGSKTSNLDRSFSTTLRSRVRDLWIPRRPSQRFRSRRIIQNDLIADYDAVSVILRKRMSHGLAGGRALYVVAYPRHGDALQRRRPNDEQYDIWADYGPANWERPHRFVASYFLRSAVSQGLVAASFEVRRGGMAGSAA